MVGHSYQTPFKDEDGLSLTSQPLLNLSFTAKGSQSSDCRRPFPLPLTTEKKLKTELTTVDDDVADVDRRH